MNLWRHFWELVTFYGTYEKKVNWISVSLFIHWFDCKQYNQPENEGKVYNLHILWGEIKIEILGKISFNFQATTSLPIFISNTNIID